MTVPAPTVPQRAGLLGDRPLKRMRDYTTASLVLVVSFFCLFTVFRAETPGLIWLYAVSGAVTVEYSRHWEKAPAWWHTAGAFALTLGVWVHAALTGTSWGSIFVAIVVSVVAGRQRRWLLATIVGLAIMLAPLGLAALVTPNDRIVQFATAITAIYGAAIFIFLLNRYGFGLYLEIDSARQVSADLAVAEERYRFAADLHDIQGHTLHVIKLKTQLAEKLLDRDPAAAREQLREAQGLIAETLANTKSLAYGSRHVGVASELANAEQLFSAAGIGWTVVGEPLPHPDDELFGLVVREATTNILRHAQPTSVSVTIEPGRLEIANDGSPSAVRSPSGLARLADRFAAVGGSLRTSSVDGVFTTEARLP